MNEKNKNNKIADLMVNESKIIEAEAKQIQQEAINLKSLAAHLETNTDLSKDLPLNMRINIVLFKIRKYIWIIFSLVIISLVLLLNREQNSTRYLLNKLNSSEETYKDLMEKIDIKDNEISDLHDTLDKIEDTFEYLVKENKRLSDDCIGRASKDPIIVDNSNNNKRYDIAQMYEDKARELREDRKKKLEASSVPKEKREQRKIKKHHSKNAIIL